MQPALLAQKLYNILADVWLLFQQDRVQGIHYVVDYSEFMPLSSLLRSREGHWPIVHFWVSLWPLIKRKSQNVIGVFGH